MEAILLIFIALTIILLVAFVKITIWIWSLIFRCIGSIFSSIFTDRTLLVLAAITILFLI